MPLSKRSRRSFLTAAGVTLGALALGNSFPRLLLSWRRRDPGELTAKELSGQVGSVVTLRAEDGTRFSACIASVSEKRPQRRVEQFTMILESELREAIPQGIFEMQSTELGACELFLVPVLTRRDRIDYEVSFSRLHA